MKQLPSTVRQNKQRRNALRALRSTNKFTALKIHAKLVPNTGTLYFKKNSYCFMSILVRCYRKKKKKEHRISNKIICELPTTDYDTNPGGKSTSMYAARSIRPVSRKRYTMS